MHQAVKPVGAGSPVSVRLVELGGLTVESRLFLIVMLLLSFIGLIHHNLVV